MHELLIDALIAGQVFVVAFLALHDWIPLGRLNDVKAVQAADSKARLIRVTLLSTLPFALGLAASLYYLNAGFPRWLTWYLAISYGLLVAGAIRAWWAPYLFHHEPARAARYHAMFARTHAFLPARNGIRPNTAHVSFHVVVITLLAILAILANLNIV
jgi:hypothetical protein